LKKRTTGLCLALGLAAAGSFTAQAREGQWELSENGKYWRYMYAPDEPAKDEWIEDQGKTYYVDSKGNMKTGWVTDKDAGKKYYMGPDGAMCFNTFSADNKYVGPEGTVVDAYDKYRKAIRSEIKKSTQKKKTRKKGSQAEPELQQFFLLTDLNMDGYKDLVIMAGVQEAENLVKVAVWVPQEQKFELSAEFDVPDDRGRSTLYLDPEGEEVWLEMSEKSGEMNLFQMEYDSTWFKNVWSFSLENDEDGDLRYYVNGDEEDREYWELSMAEARQQRGSTPVTGYLPATEENQKAQIDRILTEEELDLWE